MAGIESVYQKELFLHSVHETLKQKVFSLLKEPLMKLAEEEIDKQCRKAVEEMDVAIESFRDPYYMRDQINILYRGQNG